LCRVLSLLKVSSGSLAAFSLSISISLISLSLSLSASYLLIVSFLQDSEDSEIDLVEVDAYAPEERFDCESILCTRPRSAVYTTSHSLPDCCRSDLLQHRESTSSHF
jgi:hypothetical protein